MNNLGNTYTLPIGITTITKSMLDDIRGKKQITHVIIPLGVTSIEEKAFIDSKYLTSVTIPNSVTSIGKRAFMGCSRLISVNIPYGITKITAGLFAYCSSLTTTNIPSSVTTIEVGAFRNCSSLTSITIPNSVESIELGAFTCCTNITSITIPNSVTSLDDDVFSSCSKLRYVNIPNNVVSIGDRIFFLCTNLTTIDIGKSVTSIGNSAFYGCSSLTLVAIDESITNIGRKAFEKCTNLRHVIIPASIKSKDVNYWNQVCINTEKTQLISQDQLTNLDRHKKLSSSYSYCELFILHQLQEYDNFTPSWSELIKLIPNVAMHDLLKNLPENKIHRALPKTYKAQPATRSLEHLSFFNFTPKSPEQEQDIVSLKRNGFKKYQDLSAPLTITRLLNKLDVNESNAILKWLTLHEVAALLRAKASSRLKPTQLLTTHTVTPVMQG